MNQQVGQPAPEVPFKIDIDGAAVNQMVANAILNSAIGEELKKTIGEAVNKTLKADSWGRSPIIDVVNNYIRKEIESLIQAEFSGPIREKVKLAISDQLTDEIIGKLVQQLWNNR